MDAITSAGQALPLLEAQVQLHPAAVMAASSNHHGLSTGRFIVSES